MRAESLPGRVVAIVSRRAPAFQPLPGEHPGLAWTVRAALPGARERVPTAVIFAPGSAPSTQTEPVVTVQPWRWRPSKAGSLTAGSARPARLLPSLVGLVAICLLAVTGLVLTIVVPREVSAPAGPPPSSTATLDPGQTVLRYFAAINAKDYPAAWALGGRNLSQDYQAFVGRYASTATIRASIVNVQGEVVGVALVITAKDGTSQDYQGTYTVHDGVITSSNSLRMD